MQESHWPITISLPPREHPSFWKLYLTRGLGFWFSSISILIWVSPECWAFLRYPDHKFVVQLLIRLSKPAKSININNLMYKKDQILENIDKCGGIMNIHLATNFVKKLRSFLPILSIWWGDFAKNIVLGVGFWTKNLVAQESARAMVTSQGDTRITPRQNQFNLLIKNNLLPKWPLIKFLFENETLGTKW